MFLQAEGVDEDGGATAVGDTAQDALATRIGGVLLLVGGGGIPLRQAVEQIVAERGAGAARRASGDAAKGVVAARWKTRMSRFLPVFYSARHIAFPSVEHNAFTPPFEALT